MKVEVEIWKISEFVTLKDEINEQPPYQRGEVWPLIKKKHLIDSILRGIDIPKIYFRRINKGLYKYEVADGQQRLTAILKYLEDGFRLDDKQVNGLNLAQIDGYPVGKKRFSELDSTLQNKLNDYKLTIAIVENATNNEIRTLFGRLQLGSSLNTAEKRNAIISTMGDQIDNFCKNHKFFNDSKIPSSRYRRQDYLTHGIALIKYKNLEPLKADLLLKLYLDNSAHLSQQELKLIDQTLDYLYELDQISPVRVVNKVTFIDFYYFFYSNLNKFQTVDYLSIAENFAKLDRERLFYRKNGPEQLISKIDTTPYERDLYDYIDAFHNSGYESSKITVRSRVFSSLFGKFLK